MINIAKAPIPYKYALCKRLIVSFYFIIPRYP